jgi:hypothetical protein
VKDYGRSLGSASAIIPHQQIALDDLNSLSVGAKSGESLNPCRVSRRPDEATQPPEAEIEQLPHNTLPYETGSPRYQDEVIRPDYVRVAFHLSLAAPLLGDVWLSERTYSHQGKQQSQVVAELN